MNFSKINLLLIFLAVFIIIAGVFAYQWWQIKGELGKQIEQNENLIKQMDELQAEIEELQKEIEELKAVEGKPDKEEITITTDKTEYKQGETIKITIRNNTDKIIFGGYYFSRIGLWDLEKLEGGHWIELSTGLWRPGKFSCQPFSPEQPLAIKKWEPYCEIREEWDQKTCRGVKEPEGEPIIIDKGVYRVKFTYGFEISLELKWDRCVGLFWDDKYVCEGIVEEECGVGEIKTQKIIYSNPFIIK